MNLIDLHCDTLYKSVTRNIPINSTDMEVLPVSSKDKRLQCYAIWLPDDLNGDEAEAMFFKAHKIIMSECKRCNINLINDFKNLKNQLIKPENAVFTVENAIALNGKIENVQKFAECGVRIMTLTWNSSNHIGGGAESENRQGITNFGKSCIAEMEKIGIIIDISHASDNLFYDVAQISKKPFVATHSNSRTITNHKRNLTDEQFKIIIKRDGIVGINFHNAFLNAEPEKATMYDILKHTEHFLSLGGENNLSIGSDFDGCDLPSDIKNSNSMSKIYELFLKHNYKETLIQKIFYENALNFLENFDKLQEM